jgi:alpha-D-ribose 1-methylphosphonate 5-triphosphate synthase subunit PhnL
LISCPTEKGEYRAKVGYYEDEEVYKMVSERLLEMTDAERERATTLGKEVYEQIRRVAV